MATISKKDEEKQQQQAKNGYWENELHSLGIVDPKRKKKELKDNKEELENLADNIKQAMFQDYKLAYSEKGDAHTEEAESTITVGLLLKGIALLLPSSDSSQFSAASHRTRIKVVPLLPLAFYIIYCQICSL
jgi:hypothetical protein